MWPIRVLMWHAAALTLGAGVTGALLSGATEPRAVLAAAAALGLTLLATATPRLRLPPMVLLPLAIGAGLALGAWRATALPPAAVGHSVRLPGTVIRDDGDGSLLVRVCLADLPGKPIRVLRVFLGHTPQLSPGERVAVAGELTLPAGATNPGGFDYATYCRVNGIAGIIRDGTAQQLAPAPVWRRIANLPTRAASRIKYALSRLVPEPRAALLSGLVFGAASSELPADLSADFRRAGVLHLLAASGSNVAFILGAAYWLLRRFLLLRPATIGGVLAIWAYWLMTGGGASVGRAAVMATLVLLARIVSRDGDPLTALAGAAALLTLINPLCPLDSGFQLSFAATWGIIALNRPLTETMSRSLPATLAGPLAVTLAAQAGVLPVSLALFGEQSVVAPLANLVVLPLTGGLVVTGAIAGVLGALWLPLGLPAAAAADLMLRLLIAAVRLTARLPFATVVLPAMALWWAVGYYCWLAQRAAPPRPLARGRRLAVPLILAAALVWGCVRPPCAGPGDGLVITFIDVGQGDCALVETPAGQRLLVDCGDAVNQAAERAILPYLRRANIRRLAAVIITHDHDDHRGGLPALQRSLAIRQVLTAAELHRGQRLSSGGLTITALWPEKPEEPPDTGAAGNDDSIVLRLSYCGRTVLLCGDIEAEAEGRLAPVMARGPAIDLLKVAHHGGRNSSTTEFLTAVRPRLAVISVGANNRFGHPHPDALARLTTAGAWILRTDRCGAIRVAVNAGGIAVWHWAGRGWRRLTTGVTAPAANRTTHGLHLCQR